MPAESTQVQAAIAAVAGVWGQTPRINPMHTGSDIRNPMVQRGIPAIGIGPLYGDLTQKRGHDECVDAGDHLRFVVAAAGIIAQWCGLLDGA